MSESCKRLQRWRGFCGFLFVTLLLVGCSSTAAPSATAVPPTATPRPATVTPASEPATPQSQRLTLCSPEPATLSPFDPSTASADILALVFEEPAERVNSAWEARLLAHIPTVADGDIVTRTVSVVSGARYSDEAGILRVNESSEALLLPQLLVTFTLQSELFWSDGTPLTMRDALLGYHLAQAPEAQGRWHDLAERTAQFEVLDPQTAHWVGLPGFLSADAPGFLFPPQPAHRYSELTLSEILSERAPIGTGPFVIESWQAGVGARLRPNPYYAGSPPLLDEVTVLFPEHDVTQWPQLVAAGECDVVLPAAAMQVNWQSWAQLMEQGEAIIWADTGFEPVFQRLDFNLAPIDGRLTPLSDLRVRQAVGMCIDRNRLALAQPGQAFLPAESFVPPDYPGFAGTALARLPYSPEQGQILLEEVGWRDADFDGVREAHAVADIAEGLPLSLTLVFVPQYTVAAANIAADLEVCGVGVVPQPVDARALYTADSASLLIGRRFDLVVFGWSAEAPAVCGAWRSDRIPSAENNWVGENFSGYASSDYDAACRRALLSVDPAAQSAALQEAGSILSRDLPTLFLTWRPDWFVARPEVQGVRPDASNLAALWNAEALSIKE